MHSKTIYHELCLTAKDFSREGQVSSHGRVIVLAVTRRLQKVDKLCTYVPSNTCKK